MEADKGPDAGIELSVMDTTSLPDIAPIKLETAGDADMNMAITNANTFLPYPPAPSSSYGDDWSLFASYSTNDGDVGPAFDVHVRLPKQDSLQQASTVPFFHQPSVFPCSRECSPAPSVTWYKQPSPVAHIRCEIPVSSSVVCMMQPSSTIPTQKEENCVCANLEQKDLAEQSESKFIDSHKNCLSLELEKAFDSVQTKEKSVLDQTEVKDVSIPKPLTEKKSAQEREKNNVLEQMQRENVSLDQEKINIISNAGESSELSGRTSVKTNNRRSTRVNCRGEHKKREMNSSIPSFTTKKSERVTRQVVTISEEKGGIIKQGVKTRLTAKNEKGRKPVSCTPSHKPSPPQVSRSQQLPTTPREPRPCRATRKPGQGQRVWQPRIQEEAFERWRLIGQRQGLTNDTQIAIFLMQHYEDMPCTEHVNQHCSTCRTTLTLLCPLCHANSPLAEYNKPNGSACSGVTGVKTKEEPPDIPTEPDVFFETDDVEREGEGEKIKRERRKRVRAVESGQKLTERSPLKIKFKTNKYKCTYINCEATFAKSSRLKIHTRIHTGEKPYVCQDCGKAFTQKSGLTVHSQKHSGLRPFSCEECNATFPSTSTLKQHMRRHTGEKPFACKKCTKTFRWSGHLTQHMRMHDGIRPFLCPDCGKSFSASSDLVKHRVTHTKSRPYQCGLCDKAYAFQHRLTAHLRTHTGDRPFLCSECGAAFSRAHNLTVHMRTHTGDKPYWCKDCGAKFSDSGNFCKHKKSKHGDISKSSPPLPTLSTTPSIASSLVLPDARHVSFCRLPTSDTVSRASRCLLPIGDASQVSHGLLAPSDNINKASRYLFPISDASQVSHGLPPTNDHASKVSGCSNVSGLNESEDSSPEKLCRPRGAKTGKTGFDTIKLPSMAKMVGSVKRERDKREFMAVGSVALSAVSTSPTSSVSAGEQMPATDFKHVLSDEVVYSLPPHLSQTVEFSSQAEKRLSQPLEIASQTEKQLSQALKTNSSASVINSFQIQKHLSQVLETHSSQKRMSPSLELKSSQTDLEKQVSSAPIRTSSQIDTQVSCALTLNFSQKEQYISLETEMNSSQIENQDSSSSFGINSSLLSLENNLGTSSLSHSNHLPLASTNSSSSLPIQNVSSTLTSSSFSVQDNLSPSSQQHSFPSENCLEIREVIEGGRLSPLSQSAGDVSGGHSRQQDGDVLPQHETGVLPHFSQTYSCYQHSQS